MKTLMGYGIWILLLSALFCGTSITPALADQICYKTVSKKTGNNNVLQIFGDTKCPKGYSAVSNSLLTQSNVGISAIGQDGKTGPKGDTGATGPQGLQGDQGETGPQGDRGASGAKGLKGLTGQKGAEGATGEQGAKGSAGAQGAQGNQGSQGDKGKTGAAAQDYFNFSGTTSSVTTDANRTNIFPISGSAKASASTTADIDRLGVPAGNSCSKVAYTVNISTAPGGGKYYIVYLDTTKGFNSGTSQALRLCVIAGDATNCAGTADIAAGALNSDTALTLDLIPYNGASPTTANWNVHCLAEEGACAADNPDCNPSYRQNCEDQRDRDNAFTNGLLTGCFMGCRNVSECIFGCVQGQSERNEITAAEYNNCIKNPVQSCSNLATTNSSICGNGAMDNKWCNSVDCVNISECTTACHAVVACSEAVSVSDKYCARSKCVADGGTQTSCLPTGDQDCEAQFSKLKSYASDTLTSCKNTYCASFSGTALNQCLTGCTIGEGFVNDQILPALKYICLRDAASSCQVIHDHQDQFFHGNANLFQNCGISCTDAGAGGYAGRCYDSCVQMTGVSNAEQAELDVCQQAVVN